MQRSNNPRSDKGYANDWIRRFVKLMSSGNTGAATRLITASVNSSRVLRLDDRIGEQMVHQRLVNELMCQLLSPRSLIEEVKISFKGEKLKLVAEGTKILGSDIGSDSYINEFVRMKVDSWLATLNKLALVAREDSHVAYISLVQAIQFQWTHVQRTCQAPSALYGRLSEYILKFLIPEITGSQVDKLRRDIVSLPLNQGGIGIINPTSNPQKFYSRSLPQKDCAASIRKENMLLVESRTKSVQDRCEVAGIHLHRSYVADSTSSQVKVVNNAVSIYIDPVINKTLTYLLTYIDPRNVSKRDVVPVDMVNRTGERNGDMINHTEDRNGGKTTVSQCTCMFFNWSNRLLSRDEQEALALGSDFVISTPTRHIDALALLKNVTFICKVSSREFTGNTNDANDEYLRRDHIADVQQSSVHPVHDSELQRIKCGTFHPVVLSTTGAIGPTDDQLLKTMAQRMATTSYRGYTDCIYHLRPMISTQMAMAVSMALRLRPLITLRKE
ncbi:hypothetical protein GJ496_007048 [Pomphorhynchus laevis]|nr:hypothetical protein GJ496_007048 [Pomphorhynchus laevis]